MDLVVHALDTNTDKIVIVFLYQTQSKDSKDANSFSLVQKIKESKIAIANKAEK